MSHSTFILGLIVNPIAGMGGSVGLKGTDGRNILNEAIALGAIPNAQKRTKELLQELTSVKTKLKFITCPKFMGEYVLEDLNYKYEILDHPLLKTYETIFDTSNQHTLTAARLLVNECNLDLLIFVGGDGTARDIQSAVIEKIPCLGIPAGVKIYSSVFAITPRIASSLIIQFLWGEIPLRRAEVLDIDEEAFREGRLVSKLYGYLLTPFNPDFSQWAKLGTPDSDLTNQERIAKKIVETLEKDVYYLIGPGTTTKAITDLLNQEKSVLGVDLLLNREIVALDLNEQEILPKLDQKAVKIIVSPIGRQGFIFGRGNLQFTPKILKKVSPKNIIIVSTKYKLMNIPNNLLRIDTRDHQLDEEMKGLYKIIVDYDELRIIEVK
ncbi:MAG: ATP-NAD kinase [Promethearchaeota archaeon]|nr:MAG: ATP-NAD kinase [Candidatus Lokiarchaeota archaeon]